MNLDIGDLWFRYGAGQPWVNREIAFSVAAGEIACLLGPNGAGKTTLVRQVMGLLRPVRGRLRIAGADAVADPSVAAKHCAYLPQGPFPFPEMLVGEILHCLGQLRGLRGAALARAVDSSLAYWGLEGSVRRMIGSLSGGQRRLAALAATTLGPREVFILDEPTNDLAPEMRVRVWHKLEALRAAGASVILVTHNVREVQQVVSQVVMLVDGRVAHVSHGVSGDGAVGADTPLSVNVPEAAAALAARIAGAERLDARRWRIPADGLAELYLGVAECFGAGMLAQVHVERGTLEDMYFRFAERA